MVSLHQNVVLCFIFRNVLHQKRKCNLIKCCLLIMFLINSQQNNHNSRQERAQKYKINETGFPHLTNVNNKIPSVQPYTKYSVCQFQIYQILFLININGNWKVHLEGAFNVNFSHMQKYFHTPRFRRVDFSKWLLINPDKNGKSLT